MIARYVGRTFNKWTIISFDRVERSIAAESGKSYSNYYWNCRCECGTVKSVHQGAVVYGKSRSCSDCSWKVYKDKHPKWKGSGDLTGVYWCRVRKGASSRKIPLVCTKEEAYGIFLKQEGRCALTGMELSLDCPQTASLDRIDSKGIYEVGNLQWIHRDLNRMKNAFPEQYFIEMCRAVARHADKG